MLIGALLLGATPQQMLGRVTSVINPMQQLAGIVSMGCIGFLASTALRGFHATVAGLTFGPYDVVFAGCGLVFVAAGLAVIGPLRAAGRDMAGGDTAGADTAGTGPADVASEPVT